MRYLTCSSVLLVLLACGNPAETPAEEVEPENREIELAMNGRADLGSRTELVFLKVSEDSRCPPGVTCVWEGRAVLSLGLESSGQSLGTLELTVQAGRPELATGELGDFRLTVLDLSPFSMASEQKAPEYRVKLMVQKK